MGILDNDRVWEDEVDPTDEVVEQSEVPLTVIQNLLILGLL